MRPHEVWYWGQCRTSEQYLKFHINDSFIQLYLLCWIFNTKSFYSWDAVCSNLQILQFTKCIQLNFQHRIKSFIPQMQFAPICKFYRSQNILSSLQHMCLTANTGKLEIFKYYIPQGKQAQTTDLDHLYRLVLISSSLIKPALFQLSIVRT